MADAYLDSAAQNEHLNEVLADYLEAARKGQAPDRRELLARHPELAADLAAFFAEDDKLRQLAASATSTESATLAPPASAPAATLGTIRYFGDYELLDKLAEGGMGVVFKARQRSLNRPVAVKMILHGAFASPESLRRFEREARAAAALDHPNIVPVYEFGQHEGRPYFAMLLVEGENLSTLVRKQGPRPPREAVALLLGVADAVQYAHQAGIIHRDLKPENVLVDRQGRPRVTDFGLAKQVGEASGMTETGRILGTPAYMAPEQARGDSREVGPEADVYALGCILYFLLTGQPPFVGGSVMEVLRKVEYAPVCPPRSLNTDIPAVLETIVLCCLEKAPACRYPTAAALYEALRLVADQSTTISDSPRPKTEVLLNALRGDPPARHAEPKPEKSAMPVLSPGPAPRPVPSGPRFLLLGLTATILLAGSVLLTRPTWLFGPGTSSSSPAGSLPGALSFAAASGPWALPEPSRQDFKLEARIFEAGTQAGDISHYRIGDKLHLLIAVARDAYVGVWNIEANGNCIQLFPNEKEQNYLIKAGTPRVLPGKLGYDIEALTVSTGVERLCVVASTRKWDPLAGQKMGPFTVFKTDDDRARIDGLLRGIRGKRGFGVKVRPEDAVAEVGLKYLVLPAQ